MLHLTGAIGLVGIAVLYPLYIWRNCKRIVIKDKWDDEHQQVCALVFHMSACLSACLSSPLSLCSSSACADSKLSF